MARAFHPARDGGELVLGRRRSLAVCELCEAVDHQELVQPWPSRGRVHRRCFAELDRMAEALECSLLSLPLGPMLPIDDAPDEPEPMHLSSQAA